MRTLSCLLRSHGTLPLGWVLAAALLVSAAVPAPAQTCAGDCDGDREVSIDELIRGVRIALGLSEVAACPAIDTDADGAVSVAELVTAVRAALDACGANPPPPTATPVGLRCGDGRADGLEECDDGGVESGDGCSSDCQLEPGGDVCSGISPSSAESYVAVRVAAGLANPVHVTAPPLDPNRLFVVEQAGFVRLIKTAESGRELLGVPFLDISSQVMFAGGFDERGLLGMAFHPDYENNGWFFVNYTCRDLGCPEGVPNSATIVSRFEVGPDGDTAVAGSERVLLAIRQPARNHNGGQVAFGPDGMLYVGMGDGGFQGDPNDHGQRDDTLLGKMLRIDVDVADAPYWRVPDDNPNPVPGELGLIWAKGLRNPWRFSFDRATGDLYIGDVGQNMFEEIDVQPGDSQGGENYGWDIFEGVSCFEPEPGTEDCPGPPESNEFVFPVLQYGRAQGVSVTGGFVYRGCVLDSLAGTYLFADFLQVGLRSLFLLNGTATRIDAISGRISVAAGLDVRGVSSFGEDARGELYIVDRTDGEVFMLMPDS